MNNEYGILATSLEFWNIYFIFRDFWDWWIFSSICPVNLVASYTYLCVMRNTHLIPTYLRLFYFAYFAEIVQFLEIAPFLCNFLNIFPKKCGFVRLCFSHAYYFCTFLFFIFCHPSIYNFKWHFYCLCYNCTIVQRFWCQYKTDHQYEGQGEETRL